MRRPYTELPMAISSRPSTRPLVHRGQWNGPHLAARLEKVRCRGLPPHGAVAADYLPQPLLPLAQRANLPTPTPRRSARRYWRMRRTSHLPSLGHSSVNR